MSGDAVFALFKISSLCNAVRILSVQRWYNRKTMVKTSNITQKYTHPNAYFPDCDQGSTVLASINPAGLLELYGMLIRFSSTGVEDASGPLRSCTAATSSNSSSATPARLARSSTRAGILKSILGTKEPSEILRSTDVVRSRWPPAMTTKCGQTACGVGVTQWLALTVASAVRVVACSRRHA